MSEPIIIETPAPPTRERLVVVRESVSLSEPFSYRDATPEDLERAGYVLREQAAPGTLAHLRADLRDMTARAEQAEREREECESVLTAMGARAREAEEFARVLEVERDTLRAELARIVAAGVTVATADEAALFEVVEQPEMLPPDNSRILSSGLTEAVEVDLMGIVDTAIGRLDSYGASLVCRGSASGAAHSVALDAYRLGVAHERARQQPAQDRATDEELVEIFGASWGPRDSDRANLLARRTRLALAAVAARVRQERCLVARAVDARMAMHVYRCGPDGWEVALGPRFVECERADVPATLARLLGEVAK